MSQQEGLTSAFIAGTVVGGVIGGVLGAILAARYGNDGESQQDSLVATPNPIKRGRGKKESPGSSDEESIEAARRSLEDKIAQLNDAIDDVRRQLGGADRDTTQQLDDRQSLAQEP